MTNAMKRDPLYRTAIHEIGHAMLFFGKFPDQDFTVDLTPDGQTTARLTPHQSEEDLAGTALTREYVQGVLWVCVAGESAEYEFFGDADALLVRLDHWKFARYAGLLLEIIEHAGYVIRPTQALEAERSALAVDNLHRTYFLSCRRLFRAHRAVMEQAAEQLLRRKRLTRDELGRLLDAAAASVAIVE